MSQKQIGMTLLELVVAVAILSVLVAAAAPSMQSVMNDATARSLANQLMADLNLARGEALRTARVTQVRQIGGSWDNGWTVMQDTNNDGTVDQELRRFDGLPDGFGASLEVGGAGEASIGFTPLGRSDEPNDIAHIHITRPDGITDRERSVCIAPSGRSEILKGDVCT